MDGTEVKGAASHEEGSKVGGGARRMDGTKVGGVARQEGASSEDGAKAGGVSRRMDGAAVQCTKLGVVARRMDGVEVGAEEMAVQFDPEDLKVRVKLFVKDNIHGGMNAKAWYKVMGSLLIYATGLALDCEQPNFAEWHAIMREGRISSRRLAGLSVADDKDDMADTFGGPRPPPSPDSLTSFASSIWQ